MSLRDVVPWSIIYGEQNKQHMEEMQDMTIMIIAEYLKNRIIYCWGALDTTLPRAVRYCIEKGYVTDETLQSAVNLYRDMCKYSSPYEQTQLELYVAAIKNERCILKERFS